MTRSRGLQWPLNGEAEDSLLSSVLRTVFLDTTGAHCNTCPRPFSCYAPAALIKSLRLHAAAPRNELAFVRRYLLPCLPWFRASCNHLVQHHCSIPTSPGERPAMLLVPTARPFYWEAMLTNSYRSHGPYTDACFTRAALYSISIIMWAFHSRGPGTHRSREGVRRSRPYARLDSVLMQSTMPRRAAPHTITASVTLWHLFGSSFSSQTTDHSSAVQYHLSQRIKPTPC